MRDCVVMRYLEFVICKQCRCTSRMEKEIVTTYMYREIEREPLVYLSRVCMLILCTLKKRLLKEYQ